MSDVARADLCVLNSCAVTQSAERKSRRRLRALAVALGLVAVLTWGWFGGGGREVAADGLRKAADIFDGGARPSPKASGDPVQLP